MAGIITDESINDPRRGFVGGYEMETLALGLPFMAGFLIPGVSGWGEKVSNALENYDKVLSIKQDYAPAHQGKAIVNKKLLKFDEAIYHWQKVFELNPGNSNALVQKGDLLFDLNRLDESLKAYNEALKIDPDKSFLLGSIVHTKTKMCDWDNLDRDISSLQKKILNDSKGSSPYTTLTIYDDPKIHLKAAKVWSEEHLKKEDQKIFKNFQIKKNKKIKIGYYSADFRTHAMGHLLVRMFELHDKENFEIYNNQEIIPYNLIEEKINILLQRLINNL